MAFGRVWVKKSELEGSTKAKQERSLYDKLWSERPNLDKINYTDSSGAILTQYPFHPRNLYQMSLHVDALRIILEALRREMFRSKIKVVESYAYKCRNCKKEFKSKPEGQNKELECDNCHKIGERWLVRPNYRHGQILESMLSQPVNINEQKLRDVLKQIEWDLDVFDNAYLLLLKEYEIDPLSGEIKKRTIKEIIRGDALQILLIADAQGKLGHESKGGSGMYMSGVSESQLVLVCPRPDHRYKKITGKLCGQCGAMGVRAIATTKQVYGSYIGGSAEYYYIDGEVLFGSKYQPSLLYGYSPIYALWQKVMTLYYQDRYMLTYYDKQRSPNAILAVATKSISSFAKAWDLLKSWHKEDPHRLHPLAIETERGGKNVIQFVDLMRNLADMQYIEQRNEFRRTIGASYGVLPLFSGDLPSGWNNEGLQAMVTNRAIHSGQEILEEMFLNKLAMRMGIKDWRFEFERSESADKLRDLQIQQMLLANATALHNLGFDIWFDHNDNLQHDKIPSKLPVEEGASDEVGFRTSNPVENVSDLEGEPAMPRPSDMGGKGEGFPASGTNTSMSKKARDIEHVNKGLYSRLAENDNRLVDDLTKSLSEFDGDTIKRNIGKSIDGMRDDAQRQVWQYNYAGVAGEQDKFVRDIVQLSFTLNLPKSVARENLKAIGVTKEQADLIIQTEYQHALNRAKELAYRELDPEGTKYKYFWDTSADSRVCPACKEAEILTKNGVSLDELIDVIQAVAKKHKRSAVRKYHLHPSDRCVMKRHWK